MSRAWWNGRLVPAEEVRIAPDDPGFLFGDGLFETLRVDGGRPRDLPAHLDRLYAGLHRLGIELPERLCDLGHAVFEVAQAAPRPVARLRITISRETRLIAALPYEPPGEDLYERGVAAVLLPDYRIDSRGPLAGLKSLSYQMNRLALREAEARGAWEALLVNEHGRLVEGSRSNLALVLPEGIFTPPESEGCLPGTVRRRLLEAGAVRERPLSLEDLARGNGLLLMNSLIGVLPVSRIDGREIPVDPKAARLRDLLPTAGSPGWAAPRPPRA
jgi:branched-subunit amino acid aminotransferase/4-amino-4-deoxychorismate lyase